jgi:glycosyltransferase involved in cell wall biosynthesis
MKICLVTGEFPPMQGGVGDYTNELARALLEQGAEVTVITSVKAASGERQAPGVRVVPVFGRWGWRTWRYIPAILRRYEADIVHIQYQAAAFKMHPAINLLPWRLRWSRQRPVVMVTFHDLRVPYLFPKAGPVRWWTILALARYSDAIIVTNPQDWDRLAAYEWMRSLHLVPIGSNIPCAPPPDYDRTRWRARLGLREDQALLAYFGFLNASKGGETLIEALHRLVQAGRDVHLLMIGGKVGDSDPTNVAYLEQIDRLIEARGLNGRVLWTGFVSDAEVSGHFLAADVCVLPYRDGASFRRGSLMAALTHGVPVVTTHPQEVSRPLPVSMPRLEDGVNARLVPPDDPAALARAVESLLDAPEERRRLGAAAAKLARAFAWDRIAAQHIAIYQSLLKV